MGLTPPVWSTEIKVMAEKLDQPWRLELRAIPETRQAWFTVVDPELESRVDRWIRGTCWTCRKARELMVI